MSARVAQARPPTRRAARRLGKRVTPVLPAETPRARILDAAETLICARGAAHVTATAVTGAARVSRTTFYAIFADREDCQLAVFDEVADRLGAAMLAAYTAESSWLDGVRAALCELLAQLDREPNLARFLIVGGVSGDSALVKRRRQVLAELARSLEADSPALDSQETPVPFGSQALVSGAASIIHSRLLEEPVPRLTELGGSLMAVLVLPFVGEGVARSELGRPSAPRRRVASPPAHLDHASPLSAARVTERTARVLAVIGSSPGVSNRSVARHSGNIDEGQISKLLARLSHLDLIANRAPDTKRGGSNAWFLTRGGADLLAALPPARQD